MPRFEAFPGLRYNPDKVRLDQVIAPPYDVIAPAERMRLAARSAVNSVHVELPEPDLKAGIDRYQVAALLFEAWRVDGILRAEAVPSLYLYRMTTQDQRSSTGVIGALGLPEPGQEGEILPHEETIARARTDRLELLRATRANLSPIWGLSLASGLSALLDPRGEPAIDVFDDDSVRHQLWVLDDPAAIDAITRSVASAPIVIADGHHRYETARTYRAEQRQAHGDRPGGYDLVMALVTELSEEQLSVGPIHRTISGLPAGTDLPGRLGEWFDVVRAGPSSERMVSALADSSSLALVTTEDAWLLAPRPATVEASERGLDTSMVSLALGSLPPHTVTYRHSAAEVWRALVNGEAEAALLLRPVTVAQIGDWARRGRRMPPKTTYFSPKPRTGMVFRALDEDPRRA